MLMLLSVHVTSFLFSVWFNNFASYRLLLELCALTLVARSYVLLLVVCSYPTDNSLLDSDTS